MSTTLLPFRLSGKLAFTQFSTVIEFMPPRINRYLLLCRIERSFLVISISSPSGGSRALANTCLPQYGNECLLWSNTMMNNLIFESIHITIKPHQMFPEVVVEPMLGQTG
uniref:Uncharacterized protein n=1 Tax=Leersia perrieri TaxID=77586 RepID=A0A0D9XR59_9ORYZ